tara:strand:- start:189 stop:329 length:141 start_codon:yes stop_codon:yes gene_type:complete
MKLEASSLIKTTDTLTRNSWGFRGKRQKQPPYQTEQKFNENKENET